MKTIKLGRGYPLCFIVAAIAGVGTFPAIAEIAEDVRSAVFAGQQGPAFQARTVDGLTVNFPSDYKGGVVLLDFWATWCGPCRQELPNVVATYQKFHTQGFDVVSVSLDEPRNGPALLEFVQEHNMTWPQIYDGLYWNSAVAVLYGIKAIPCPVLVDGDNGKIIAQGADALGDQLPELVENALAAKGRKLPGLDAYDPKAPDCLTVVINHQTISAWRTGQLENAKKEAMAKHKPIAWVVSGHQYWDGLGEISEEGSRGATLHALYALRSRAVLVFEDGFIENHKVLPLVDNAAHTPDPHPVLPVVVFLNPDATHALADALGEVAAKMDAAPAAANK